MAKLQLQTPMFSTNSWHHADKDVSGQAATRSDVQVVDNFIMQERYIYADKLHAPPGSARAVLFHPASRISYKQAPLL